MIFVCFFNQVDRSLRTAASHKICIAVILLCRQPHTAYRPSAAIMRVNGVHHKYNFSKQTADKVKEKFASDKPEDVVGWVQRRLATRKKAHGGTEKGLRSFQTIVHRCPRLQPATAQTNCYMQEGMSRLPVERMMDSNRSNRQLTDWSQGRHVARWSARRVFTPTPIFIKEVKSVKID